MSTTKRAVLSIVLGIPLAFGSWPTSVAAQARQTEQDSTLILLQRLQRRLDSLERVIAQLRAASQDTTPAVDELAALRAAAGAAVEEAQQQAPPPPTDQGSRTRNLSALNPEVSVTGDVVGSFISPGGGEPNFSGTPREFEFSFQAALDPYSHTKIFVTREEEFEIAGSPEAGAAEEPSFEVEEGYMYWVGLPGGFGAKIGKFRQEIGLYNRWHTHALFEVDRPLASRAFLGDDGLVQTGASMTLPSLTFGPATNTVTVEVTKADNPVLFEGGNQLSYLGRFQSFWDLSSSTHLQLGVTGVTGENDDAFIESRLLGLDFAFRWVPPNQALYRDIQLKGEWYFAEKEVGPNAVGPDKLTGRGGYAQLNFRVDRRIILGTRADYLEPFEDGPHIIGLVPTLSWWQSEWVRLRLQYNLLKTQGGETNHTVLLQFVWAMGPHKHETY